MDIITTILPLCNISVKNAELLVFFFLALIADKQTHY